MIALCGIDANRDLIVYRLSATIEPNLLRAQPSLAPGIALAGLGNMDTQQHRDAWSTVASTARSGSIGYTSVSATDAAELTQAVRDWNFEFMQLSSGTFRANGAMLQLDGVSIARVSMSRTLLQKGFATCGTFAVFIPGAGSGPVFANGQLVETGQCATLAEGAQLEAISHEGYMDVCFGLDLTVCRSQLEALKGGALDLAQGASIAAPGPDWTNEILDRVDWLLATVTEYPQCLGDSRVRASLTDQALAAMLRFDNSPADVDATTHGARASRRAAVRIAREFIHSRLSEPLRLSDLCRHANLQVRSLEYGFREVTGLDPRRVHPVATAQCRQKGPATEQVGAAALDLGDRNGRRILAPQSVSLDYRRLFGETPTETRRIANSK